RRSGRRNRERERKRHGGNDACPHLTIPQRLVDRSRTLLRCGCEKAAWGGRDTGTYHFATVSDSLTTVTRMSRPLCVRPSGTVAADKPRRAAIVGFRLRAQVRDDPVAVAAVDRVHELDHVPLAVPCEALELERRRVQGHAERLGFLGVGDRRLD